LLNSYLAYFVFTTSLPCNLLLSLSPSCFLLLSLSPFFFLLPFYLYLLLALHLTLQPSALSISFLLTVASSYCALYILPCNHLLSLCIYLPCYILLSTPSYSVTFYSLYLLTLLPSALSTLLLCNLLVSLPPYLAIFCSLLLLTLRPTAISSALSTFLLCDFLLSLPPYIAIFCSLHLLTLRPPALSISLPCYLLLSPPSNPTISFSLYVLTTPCFLSTFLRCELLLSISPSFFLLPLPSARSTPYLATSCSLHPLALRPPAVSTLLLCNLLPSLFPYLATFCSLHHLALQPPGLSFSLHCYLLLSPALSTSLPCCPLLSVPSTLRPSALSTSLSCYLLVSLYLHPGISCSF
jgi:hypothetical protein